jgi:predicted HTH transcriptional regulator
MPDPSQLIDLIRRGREERVLEYKESAPWEGLKTKIIRTALAMANCRDGGTIVVGVSERTGTFQAEGVDPVHLQTYLADEIQEAINRHADPYVRIEFHRVEVEGKYFIVIVVYEFDEIPVVCKKEGTGLREGAIYTRSYRKPETCEVRSQTEMREILALAVDKGVREFLRRARAAEATAERAESDLEKFEKQLGEI